VRIEKNTSLFIGIGTEQLQRFCLNRCNGLDKTVTIVQWFDSVGEPFEHNGSESHLSFTYWVGQSFRVGHVRARTRAHFKIEAAGLGFGQVQATYVSSPYRRRRVRACGYDFPQMRAKALSTLRACLYLQTFHI